MKCKKAPAVLIAIFVACIAIAQSVILQPVFGSEADYKHEVRMGREAAIEVDKENKLINDPNVLERIQQVGKKLTAIANSEKVDATYGSSDVYKFDYKFKVIDAEDVNAMSLPGGIIYVNKGLLKYVQSDHELAAVLAHEIAHSAHHHMTYILKEQNRLDSKFAILLLAGLFSRMDSEDLSNVVMGMQLFRVAKASGFGQKAEADADSTAVQYMVKAGYNPVGMLTFLERLNRESNSKPNIEMGILQNHPAPANRCKCILSQIKSLNLPINRREVTNTLRADISPAVVNGCPITQVRLGDNVLFEPAPMGDLVTSKQRAEAIALKLNQLLDSEPQLREVALGENGDSVVIKGETLVVVTEYDSNFQSKPACDIAKQIADSIRTALWKEMLASTY